MNHFLKDKLFGFFESLEAPSARLIRRLETNSQLFHEIGILFAIGVICNIYFLTNFSFSIDDEIGAVRENAAIWIGQGRWTAYLVEQFLFPQPSIPFAPFIFFIACLTISYSLITRAHNYCIDWKTYACFPLFCTYPSWWFISEFYSNIPSVGLGVLLVSISAYVTFRNSSYDCLTGSVSTSTRLVIVFFLAFAVAAYQSLILLYLCLTAGITLVKLLRNCEENVSDLSKQSLQNAILVCLLSLAGIILYAIINFAAQQISGEQSSYISSFIDLDAILKDPLWWIASVFNKVLQVYSGASILFGAAMPLASVLLGLTTLSVILDGKNKLILCLVLWGAILIIPFALQFLAGANNMGIRNMLSIAYVTWLMGMLLFSQKRSLIALTGIIVIGIYQLQIINLTSQYIASANITQAHDRMLAADIYRRLGEISSDFDRTKPIEIDVYGHKNIHTIYANGWSSAMQGSFFDWDKGNLLRMTTYMKIMGYQNINMTDEEKRRSLIPLFQEMPTWPAVGSVKKLGDQYLVKLSQDPDPIHANVH